VALSVCVRAVGIDGTAGRGEREVTASREANSTEL